MPKLLETEACKRTIAPHLSCALRGKEGWASRELKTP